MSSALTDADQDAGLREEMHYAYGRHQSAGDVGATDYGRVRAAVEPILEELATLRSRATAAEAERDSMVAWAKSATHACDKAYIALTVEENNLIALAKMYGEACRELALFRWFIDRCASEDELVAHLLIEAGQERRDAYDRATAAEDKLRDREAEIKRLREALKPFCDWAEALEAEYGDHEDDVIAGGLHPDVVTFGDLRRAALASTEPPASSEEASDVSGS